MSGGNNTERLQKCLSSIGVGSRRQIDAWIAAGRVAVDGKIAKLGTKVGPHHCIEIDGAVVRQKTSGPGPCSRIRVVLYNKPAGQICSRKDPLSRPTVFENLPSIKQGRWVAAGRLDINTQGLLLFTNDGELAQKLMHPSSSIEREYLCRVYGGISASTIALLQQGRKIDGCLVKFLRVKRIRGEGRNTWYSVVVGEGRYREVRRLWESAGCTVSRLIRIRFGDIQLPRNLKVGRWMELDRKQVGQLTSSMEKRAKAVPGRIPERQLKKANAAEE